MCILERVSRLKMNSHVKNCVVFEHFAFIDVGVQECYFCVRNFSRKFDRGVVIVRLFNELYYVFSGYKSRVIICRLYSVSKLAVLMRFGSGFLILPYS